jgi:hypothetical protein
VKRLGTGEKSERQCKPNGSHGQPVAQDDGRAFSRMISKLKADGGLAHFGASVPRICSAAGFRRGSPVSKAPCVGEIRSFSNDCLWFVNSHRSAPRSSLGINLIHACLKTWALCEGSSSDPTELWRNTHCKTEDSTSVRLFCWNLIIARTCRSKWYFLKARR